MAIAVKFYKKQLDKVGRYMLHEHPDPCDSWEEEIVKELVDDERTYKVKGHMCS